MRLAVGREGALDTGGQRQRLGHAGAVGVDEEELEEVAVAGAPLAMSTFLPSGDQPTTRLPAGCQVMRRGTPPADGIDVDVVVAVEVGRVGDLGAVGRVERAGVHIAVGGEALGFAALAADGPDVVGVAEGDFVLREGRIAQQERGVGALGNEKNRKENGQCKQSERSTEMYAESSSLQRVELT